MRRVILFPPAGLHLARRFASRLRAAASLFAGRILLEGTDGRTGREASRSRRRVLFDVNRFFLFSLLIPI